MLHANVDNILVKCGYVYTWERVDRVEPEANSFLCELERGYSNLGEVRLQVPGNLTRMETFPVIIIFNFGMLQLIHGNISNYDQSPPPNTDHGIGDVAGGRG